ncbi:PPOX class F420-dependent oxidoreductase [Aggregatilineales bacterium SYSU G02658]
MSHPFDALNGHQYLSLTTYRKSGQPVATPVWFAREGDRLYVVTQADSGKVKRIRNNAQVEIAPCDVRGNLKGERFPATARILPESDFQHADRAITRKYGLMKRLFDLFQRRSKRTYLAIESL